MLSAFNTKFKALQGKVPQSTMNTPWKRTLLLVVFLVGAIVAILFFVIFGFLKVIFEASGKPSDSSTFAEDDRSQAEIDSRGLMDETTFLHQHYKMNEFGTILGPKDSEW